MESVSLLLLLFVLLIIVICILVDIFGGDKTYPLKFRFRRFLNWISLALCYGAVYIGRYNFTLLSNPIIKDSTGLSDSQYGWVITLGFWFYAFVSPFMGSIGDLKGAKKTVIFGAIGSGTVNLVLGLLLIPKDSDSRPLILGFVPPVVLFALFNATNYIFQAALTGSVGKINSGWYKKSERGVFGGIFSAILATAFFFTFNLGNMLVSSNLSWNLIFLIPAVMLISLGVISYFSVKENPKSAGFQDIGLLIENDSKPIPIDIGNEMEEKRKEETIVIGADKYESLQQAEEEEDLMLSPQQDFNSQIDDDDEVDNIEDNLIEDHESSSMLALIKNISKQVLSKENLKPMLERDTFFATLSLFFIGFIKDGFLSWFNLFLISRYGENTNPTLISISLAGVTIGSMTGGWICGWISDRFFKCQRSPALFIFFILLNSAIVILYFISSQLASTILLIILFILIFGINNVLAVTALLDFGTVKNAALFAGILTCSQYIASGFSGFLLGYIVENLGFSWWILSMIPFSVLGLLLMGYSAKLKYTGK